jgi:hypothetical protein
MYHRADVRYLSVPKRPEEETPSTEERARLLSILFEGPDVINWEEKRGGRWKLKHIHD